jgi:hypothetical protein
MDTRNILLAAAGVIVGLIVIVAVLGAVSIVWTSVFDGNDKPKATPTPLPATLTATPYAVIPSGPLGATVTPSSSTYPVVPTPVLPVVKSSELVGYGTDKDVYKRGDTAVAYIIIKNTGTVPINEAGLQIAVARYVSVVGYVNLQNSATTLTDLDIKPGETKRAEYLISIPSDYQGVSTAGKYRFTVGVSVWGKDIGSFTKEAEVQ